MAISFRNTSYENKLSKVVKSIDRWVMNTLKHKKKNEEVFHCNDIALIMSEICSISRRPSILTISRKDPCFVWFSVFFADHHNKPQYSIWYLENAKNYRTFPLWVRTHCVNGAESLNFVMSGVIEKFQCINDLMLMFCASSLQFKKLYSSKDVPFWILRIFSGCSFIRKENLAQVSSPCNIIENETPAQVFSCEFWEIFIQQR